MTEINLILLGTFMFTFIIFLLVMLILFARSRLVASGNASVIINDDTEHKFVVPVGNKLMNVLADQKIYVPSACGGGGTCGQCRVVIKEGGGHVLPTETSKLTRREIRDQCRLSCQVAVRDDMKIEIPPEVFSSKKWFCTVRSNHNVTTFIKELILELPEGEDVHFRAGGYVQVDAPPHSIHYRDFEIDEDYRVEWDKYDLWKYASKVDEPVFRAYSMANYPDEKGIIVLNVRIAVPPAYKPDAPPGKVSSYLFSLKQGDRVSISGPFGEFFARDTDNEMIFVGGGAGMAPLRSHIFDQLKRLQTKRKVSFWYGARTLRETFYVDDFNELQERYDNFEWHISLSRPHLMEEWKGYKGYVQNCLYDLYLKDHPAPEDCEYYLCGPPALVASVVMMLDGLGVEPENIMYDDFGG